MKSRTLDVGMAGNGAIAGLVGITAPSGFVEYWAAPIIGLVAGLIVVFAVLAIDKLLDDPVGALSAHGLAGIWGTLAVGIFASPRLIVEGAGPGIWYGDLRRRSRSARPSGSSGSRRWRSRSPSSSSSRSRSRPSPSIKATIGLRVSDEEEDAGLDISSHGMYGYPEQFIPQPEYSTGLPSTIGRRCRVPAPAPRSQMTATETR